MPAPYSPRFAWWRFLLVSGWLLPAVALGQTLGSQPAPTAQDDNFQAKMLLALADADMVPSAYVDGKLGPMVGHDVLNVLASNGQQSKPTSLATLPISNSVTGPPAAVTMRGSSCKRAVLHVKLPYQKG